MASSRLLVASFALVLCSACGGTQDTSADGNPDTATDRERAEAIAGSSVPGAAGVTGALGAADSAAARAARLDSAARP